MRAGPCEPVADVVPELPPRNTPPPAEADSTITTDGRPALRRTLQSAAETIEAPPAGQVRSLPACAGSGDSLLLAALLSRRDLANRTLVILTAAAPDAARLADEIAYFAPAARIRLLPDWETLPYDNLSPHQDLISERLATMYALQQGQCDLLVLAATTALQRLAPTSFLASHTFRFHKGQKLDEARLRAQLVTAGYSAVSQVVHPGEYCVRGGLLDLFPTGSRLPLRLDLFGTDIDSIRTFDPDTQRSLYPVESVQLLPGREFPLDEEARTAFRGRWRERFEGDPSRTSIYRDVGNGIATPGIEYYLPLFFGETATLFDYLPDDALVVTHGDVEAAAREFHAEARERYKFLSHDPERPLLRTDEILIGGDDLFNRTRVFGRWSLRSPPAGDPAGALSPASGKTPTQWTVTPPPAAINRRADRPLATLESLLDTTSARVLLLAESAGRRETLAELFTEHGLQLPSFDDWAAFDQAGVDAGLAIGPLHAGFVVPSIDLVVLTESELFVDAVRRRGRTSRQSTTDVESIIRDLSELRVGDPVVHAQHGVGRYQGLVTLDLGDGANEFLHLTYASDATLYVPVAQLHQIGRYSGANPDEAPLHLLGSGQWDKARRRAATQARDAAAELLNLYARRAAREGHAFPFDPHAYEVFASGFAFEETPDQLAAIHAVVQDMISGRPMDRLVCGDVGFGKTEVALRAAWVAINGGRQVAVLTPTTLLAEQHGNTFADRFAGTAVRIAELSRFRTPREVKATIAGLASGEIDMVIGTHKLLSPELRFARLGLVIVDEEHRFGVRHKEALKNLRAEVDVLTMTATPIPRTLAMSLEGIRDFSVIATAPQKRLAIKTFVRRETDGAIREALLRELKRGGQAYFLHNEVDTIEARRTRLAQLIPEARIAIAHGQMPERDLEHVMRDFHQQRFNILLCTTIIETGIDVPTANTIVIHRADRFGLAQLHQLRGRVGRSHHQAYAYLLIPDESALTKDAVKRLEAIQLLNELGSGFFLSMHDLEIRGAGEVLGESQSGNMQEVGFALYNDMLSEAVAALKAGREPDLAAPLAATTEINLHTPALLPADYCGDIHERLTLYKRLADCRTPEALETLQEELVDRFGRLPDPARALIDTHRLRIRGRALGVAKIDATAEAVMIQFVPAPPIAPERIIEFIQSRKDTRLAGPDRLRIVTATPDAAARARRVRDLLDEIGSKPKAR